jgi:hypothetical protein
MKLEANKILLFIIITSLVIKFALLSYVVIKAPSAKFMPDTRTYTEPGMNLIEKGVFATFDNWNNIQYEINRTPGYPVFIAFLRKVLRFSFDSIIFVQILLITFAGYIIYKAAYELDRNIALLAAFIFLFDLPVTISSLMLLTEALYTVFIACFMYFFLKYLRDKKISILIFSALMLAIATYVKPTSYYLGICLAGGVIYAFFRVNKKIAIRHGLILLLVFYSCLGIWHYRNYIVTGSGDFTIIDDRDLQHMGLTHNYARYKVSKNIEMDPFLYYINHTARSIMQFLALPGTLKYLGSKPLKVASKIYAYPWMIFWLIGLFFARYDKLPYRYLLFTILYFMVVSVVVIGLCVGSRFRVPVMPLISILSASGWVRIVGFMIKSGG